MDELEMSEEEKKNKFIYSTAVKSFCGRWLIEASYFPHYCTHFNFINALSSQQSVVCKHHCKLNK